MAIDPKNLVAAATKIANAAGMASCQVINPIGIGYNTLFDIDDKLIIRFGTSEDDCFFPKSAEILKQLEGKIKAPRVIHTDFSKTIVPYNVLVLEKIKGNLPCELWRDLPTANRQRILEDLSAQLAILHAEPHASLQTLGEPYHIWAKRDATTNLAAAAAAGRVAPDKLERIRQFIDAHWHLLDRAVLCLTHSDLHCNNILIESKRLAAIIDFEDATLADPLLDLHSFIDPSLAMQWQEIGQTPIDLFRVIAQNYPAPFDQEALVKLQLFCLLESTYNFAPSDQSPIDDLPTGNLRYNAVLLEKHYERLFEALK